LARVPGRLASDIVNRSKYNISYSARARPELSYVPALYYGWYTYSKIRILLLFRFWSFATDSAAFRRRGINLRARNESYYYIIRVRRPVDLFWFPAAACHTRARQLILPTQFTRSTNFLVRSQKNTKNKHTHARKRVDAYIMCILLCSSR